MDRVRRHFNVSLRFIEYRPVSQVVPLPSLEQEGLASKLGLVKSDTAWPTARHSCNISNEAELVCRSDVEIGVTICYTLWRDAVRLY